jgi:hypothetical protein
MTEIYHAEFNNLTIIPDNGILERHIGLLNDLAKDLILKTISIVGDQLLSPKLNMDVIDLNDEKIPDIIYFTDEKLVDNLLNDTNNKPLLFGPRNLSNNKNYNHIYNLTDIKYDDIFKEEEKKGNIVQPKMSLYIPDNLFTEFYKNFYYYINSEKKEFNYDNLINLCIMVKNGGDIFRKILQENLPYIDRWTILDTGSTDNTIEIIQDVLKDKKGELYQEPFINFRDSRNRCLELCGKLCKFNVMLDDTYIIKGNLREFLNTVRGDSFSDSFSFYIKSDDVEYCSNRVTKSEKNLKYIFKIHEVIQKENNKNVIIPQNVAYIKDLSNKYMKTRTFERKHDDLRLLFEELEENPDEPRTLYYIAQTFGFIQEKEKSLEYFLKRVNHKNVGFLQEKIDALFEATRLMNFELNFPWEQCEKNYLECFEMDKERPDCLYYLGVHYLESNKEKAYQYLKHAYEIGYPEHRQYGLKPTISFYFIPKFLAILCYEFSNFKLGEECSLLFINKYNEMKKLIIDKNVNTDIDYSLMSNWYYIFHLINKLKQCEKIETPQRIVSIIADGGFSEWTGRDILKNGVGGSETWVIEMTRWMEKHSKNYQYENYKYVVFCKTSSIDTFENVEYRPLEDMYNFFSENYIHTCIISRYSYYIPLAIEAGIENIHFILHDVGMAGNIVPIHPNLKKIFCLTEWHKETTLKTFPQFYNIIEVFNYGIDKKLFESSENLKLSNSFIYSSFPNRGLIILLKMWLKIREIIPDATLNIYCDLYGSGSQGKWSNDNFPNEMDDIRKKLDELKGNGITYHGWVSKKVLAYAWKKAEFWLYPCKFSETFCLTALEAATSQTLVITNDLAALQETVGNRGIVIKGDANTEEWEKETLLEIRKIKNDPIRQQDFIKINYDWSKERSWEKRAEIYFEKYIQPSSHSYKPKSTIPRTKKEMKILIILSGHRQNDEYKLSGLCFQQCPNLVKQSDLYINNNLISNDISKNTEYLNIFKTVKINNTSENAGYRTGPIEAISNIIDSEKLLISDYDYVIHLHPDVFITRETELLFILENELDSENIFIINKSLPDNRFFSFDFFIFKPQKLKENVFNQWKNSNVITEYYLYNCIVSNNLPYKMIKRFDNDNWSPRRIDLLGFWHEHDLELVKKYLLKKYIDILY